MKQQIKILVIEDDQRLCETIKNVLTLKGYSVSCAINGISGLQKAFEYRPDLILCDISMEPLDGFHVYNALKESLCDRVPFIFMTGYSDIHDRRMAMNTGADDYFVKPFNNEALVKSIEKNLDKFRKLRDIGRAEYNELIDSTPLGVFFSEGQLIVEANASFLNMLKLNKDSIPAYSIGELLDQPSFHKISPKILLCTHGEIKSFHEVVVFRPKNGEDFEADLYVTSFEKRAGYTIMAGLILARDNKTVEKTNLYPDVIKALKSENILVTESLSKKLADILGLPETQNTNQNNGFFTEREHQVLQLSMEGLPTKLIADKLSISDRTVEKHRAKLMEKTNSNNIIEVITYALKNNLIEIKSLFLFLNFSDLMLSFGTI